MTALYPGHAEAFKASYHATIGALAFGAVIYNLAAWVVRGESHLARNIAIYSALTALEVAQVQRHCDSIGKAS